MNPSGNGGWLFLRNVESISPFPLGYRGRYPAFTTMTSPSGPTCKCGKSTPLYWLHDSVWHNVVGRGECSGLACIDCAAKCLGRPLTLHDLSVQKYALSTQHNPVEFIGDYLRNTIVGAMMHYQCLPPPSGWKIRNDRPFDDAIAIGRLLAANTSNGETVVDELIDETNATFPLANSAG